MSRLRHLCETKGYLSIAVVPPFVVSRSAWHCNVALVTGVVCWVLREDYMLSWMHCEIVVRRM